MENEIINEIVKHITNLQEMYEREAENTMITTDEMWQLYGKIEVLNDLSTWFYENYEEI